MRSRQITIRDARAASVFTDSNQRRILLQFASQPRSLAEVARALAMDLKQLHHIVTRLLRLGLVDVVQTRPRAGRGVKYYQCTGDSYFIPTEAAPKPFSRGLAKELQAAIARDVGAAVDGMVFSLDSLGRASGRVVKKPGASAAPLDSWRILRLSPARANALKQALRDVLDQFQNEAPSGSQVYLVHAGMARRVKHTGATDNAVPKEP